MFVIEVPYINLDQIYNSGQIFSWIKLRDSKYVIPFKNKVLKIEQQRDRFDLTKCRLIMSCSEDDFYDIWFHYFDMETDYGDINFKAKRIGEEMSICANRGCGVRIINQDLFEMIITFCLATATNIPRIKCMVQSIQEEFGIKHVQHMREAGRVTWYEFPTPEAILNDVNKLDSCKLGFRKDVISGICQDIADGWLDLDLLKSMPYLEARDYLMQFNGIGLKVADCICLYGLHHLEAFPIDTHIDEILRTKYDCDDYNIFREWHLHSLTGYEGVIQQYMFYNEINQPMEVGINGIGGQY